MKKKLLTLLTLLLAVSSGAWADTETLKADDADGNSYTGTAFNFTATGTITADKSTATAEDDNTLTFTKGWLPGGGSTSIGNNSYKVTAKVDISSLKVYYTFSDSKFGTNDQSKSGSLKYKNGTADEVTLTSVTGSNKVAYVATISGISKDDVIDLYSSANRLVIFGVYATYTSDGVATPNVNLTGNSVTMTCSTTGATIYYTTDGTDPSSSATKSAYSTSFNLTSSCTIRAYATKDDANSEERTRDCFMDYSDALAVLQYSDGTAEGTSWTADGYTLTAASTDIAQASSFGTGVTAFKMTANETYTLQVPEDVKVTRIVVVGKTWLAGTSTFAITGFTGTGSFYATTKDGDDYTRYIGSYSFTPNSELDYGATITLTPGGTQLGAYLVVYGQERKGPADPITGLNVTEVVTIKSDGTADSSVTPNSESSRITTSGNKADNPLSGYSYGLKLESSTGSIVITLPSNATDATLVLLDKAGVTNLKFSDGTTEETRSETWSDVSTGGKAATYGITTYAGKTLTITKGSGSPVICKITLSYTIGSENEIYLTTTANMAGWRAFYDASNSYSVDANTTVYVAASDPVDDVITLTSIEGIPDGVPVILHTSSSADSYKMTLTKATAGTYTYSGTNKLEYATSAVSNVYRLGYGAEGIGFYPYSGTPTSRAVILNVSSAAEARALKLSFGYDEVTGVAEVQGSTFKAQGEFYDLQGRKVAQPTMGLYIVNGKKVIMK